MAVVRIHVSYAYNYVGGHGSFVLQSAVLTILRKAVEICNILLCGFSLFLVAAVESCMLVYDVLSYFEENVVQCSINHLQVQGNMVIACR